MILTTKATKAMNDLAAKYRDETCPLIQFKDGFREGVTFQIAEEKIEYGKMVKLYEDTYMMLTEEREKVKELERKLNGKSPAPGA